MIPGLEEVEHPLSLGEVRAPHWAIVTGEYPPQAGGVADYTRLVATGLARAGGTVSVYCPAHRGADPMDAGVAVHRLPDHFGVRGLVALHAALTSHPRPDFILVQYTPQAFGWKGMNLPFALWLACLGRRRTPVWVMFHEVRTPICRGQPFRHAVLGRVTSWMAKVVAGAAARSFVSIPAWADLLRALNPSASPAEWLPIPSTLPAAVDPLAAAEIRARVARGAGSVVVGHFGTFGGMNADLLLPILADLLRRSSDRVGLLVGRGSQQFRERFETEHADLVGRLVGTGEVSGEAAASHLSACDLLIQPYPDGVSSRRTSAMAGLALGVPTVTNSGALSEPIWGTESVGVIVTRSPQPADVVPAVEAVLALSPGERADLGKAAAAWYRSRFALEWTIAHLRSAPGLRRA
jgi:glycosyltransferase involved in cell wall biosynthesis